MKNTTNIVIVGHVDHGKSTMIGRLLYDTKSLPKDQMNEIQKISKELGKETELAFVTDQLKEEREQKITIDSAQIFFKTKKRDYCIIDAPGHKAFLKNMLTGATYARAAVLIIDVNESIRDQTRRHTFLLDMIDIDEIVIVLNKMDAIDYDRERYEAVKEELITYLENFKLNYSHIIPISAKMGDNVVKKSKNTKWYKGPTLITVLDNIEDKKPKKNLPLRFAVQDIYDYLDNTVIPGKVISGVIEKGQRVKIMPSGETATVKEIKKYLEDNVAKAEADENIGLVLDKMDGIGRGNILVDADDTPRVTDSVEAKLFWLHDKPFHVSDSYSLRCSTQEVTCTPEKIIYKMDPGVIEKRDEGSEEVASHETGFVKLKLEKPILIEELRNIEELGRFVIEKDNITQGAGVF